MEQNRIDCSLCPSKRKENPFITLHFTKAGFGSLPQIRIPVPHLLCSWWSPQSFIFLVFSLVMPQSSPSARGRGKLVFRNSWCALLNTVSFSLQCQYDNYIQIGTTVRVLSSHLKLNAKLCVRAPLKSGQTVKCAAWWSILLYYLACKQSNAYCCYQVLH